MKIKQIKAEIKRYHDQLNNNHYYTLIARVNYSNGQSVMHGINYTYGRGNAPVDDLFQELGYKNVLQYERQKNGIFPNVDRYCEDHNIKLVVIDHGYTSKKKLLKFQYKIKAIDLEIMRHFSKAGYSDFSARITINYGKKNQSVIKLPYQTGSGKDVLQYSCKVLNDLGVIKTSANCYLSNWCNQNNVIFREIDYGYNKKSDCIDFGK